MGDFDTGVSAGSKEKMHQKKMIAPILITTIVVIYYIGLSVIFLIGYTFTLWIGLMLWVVPLLLAAVMISVCRERIKEIKEGEEDDLSQY